MWSAVAGDSYCSSERGHGAATHMQILQPIGNKRRLFRRIKKTAQYIKIVKTFFRPRSSCYNKRAQSISWDCPFKYAQKFFWFKLNVQDSSLFIFLKRNTSKIGSSLKTVSEFRFQMPSLSENDPNTLVFTQWNEAFLGRFQKFFPSEFGPNMITFLTVYRTNTPLKRNMRICNDDLWNLPPLY